MTGTQNVAAQKRDNKLTFDVEELKIITTREYNNKINYIKNSKSLDLTKKSEKLKLYGFTLIQNGNRLSKQPLFTIHPITGAVIKSAKLWNDIAKYVADKNTENLRSCGYMLDTNNNIIKNPDNPPSFIFKEWIKFQEEGSVKNAILNDKLKALLNPSSRELSSSSTSSSSTATDNFENEKRKADDGVTATTQSFFNKKRKTADIINPVVSKYDMPRHFGL